MKFRFHLEVVFDLLSSVPLKIVCKILKSLKLPNKHKTQEWWTLVVLGGSTLKMCIEDALTVEGGRAYQT